MDCFTAENPRRGFSERRHAVFFRTAIAKIENRGASRSARARLDFVQISRNNTEVVPYASIKFTSLNGRFHGGNKPLPYRAQNDRRAKPVGARPQMIPLESENPHKEKQTISKFNLIFLKSQSTSRQSDDTSRRMRLNFVKRGRWPPLLSTRFKYPYPSLSHPTSTADSDRATTRSLFRVFYCPMISDLFCGVRIPQSGQPRGLSLRCAKQRNNRVGVGYSPGRGNVCEADKRVTTKP